MVPGGRLCIISYHSLEDRMVKRFIKNGDFNSEVTKDFYGNSILDFKIIGKLIRPKDAEIKLNKRSRSAMLRVAEKMYIMKKRILNFIRASFLVDEKSSKNWIYIFMFLILYILMISSSHSVDRKVFRITDLK